RACCSPAGSHSPRWLPADCRRHGVPFLPVDIGLSQAATDLEWVGPEPASATTGTGAGGDGNDTAASAGQLGIRLGLDSVAHVGSFAEVIVREREIAPFTSVADLAE